MTSAEALAIAEAKRTVHEIPPNAHSSPGVRMWIELGQAQPDRKWLVRDELVWVVRFTLPGAWIDLAISEKTREVVRVEKSRGYVLTYDQQNQEPIR